METQSIPAPQPLISVIVPVYRVEDYLPRCLDGLLAQTHENLEILLVDDGSPDNCGAICDAYAARDARIRVIHQQNGGLSAARNAGLDAAAGDYIGFVDSDDYPLPAMYETLLKLLTGYAADIAQCNVAMNVENHVRQDAPIAVYAGGRALWEAAVTDRISWPVWCNLYRAALWKDVRFPVGLYYEDVLTFPQISARCTRLVRTAEKLYYYNRLETGIVRSAKNLRHLLSKERVYETYAAYFAAHPALADLGAYYVCRNIPARRAIITPGGDISAAAARSHNKKLHRLFLKNYRAARRSPYWREDPLKKRLYRALYALCPALSNALLAKIH